MRATVSGMRIVIELKNDVNATVVLNYLYKHTQLQDTFGAIMLALVDGEPTRAQPQGNARLLRPPPGGRRPPPQRSTTSNAPKARAHILEGLLIALDNIDEVVRIIRASKSANEARPVLMERFALTEKQAQAILDMRLARLTGLEREQIWKRSSNELRETIAYLTERAGERADGAGHHQGRKFPKCARSYADERRTELTAMEGEIDPGRPDRRRRHGCDAHAFRLRQAPATRASTARRTAAARGVSAHTTREEDYVEQMYVVSSHDDIMFFTSRGRCYMIKCYEIPEAGRAARGTAIVNLLQLEGGEKVTAMIPIPDDEAERNLVMVTRNGIIKKTALEEFKNLRKAGLIAIVLREEDELIAVRLTNGHDELLVGTRDGMAIRFDESDIRQMGRVSMGVKCIDLAADDSVIDAAVVWEGAMVLSITANGYGKRTDISEYRLQSRGGKGILAMKLTDKTGPLAAQLLAPADMDLMIITDDGTIIRMPVDDIRMVGRNTQGVKLMRIAEGAQVVSVALAEPEEPEELDEPEDGETPAETPSTDETDE